MQLYEQDAEVDSLAQALEDGTWAVTTLQGDALRRARVALAWQLRERDSRRAAALADQAEADATSPDPRLLLLRAELARLDARFDTTRDLALAALRAFDALGDATGSADAHWVLGLAEANQGRTAARDQALQQALACAERAGDATRATIITAALARYVAFTDAAAGESLWGRRLPADLAGLHPAAVAMVLLYRGSKAFRLGDYATAIRALTRGQEEALRSGQHYNAIIASGNIGNAFTSLNDHEAALQWLQRAQDLARHCGWPASLGNCLSQTGETLRRLGRLDLAQPLLEESLRTLAPLEGSRNHTIALKYLGELALDRGDHQRALDWFDRLQRSGERHRLDISRPQAQALLALGQHTAAREVARQALERARSDGAADREIEALQVLARIARAQEAAGPADAPISHADTDTDTDTDTSAGATRPHHASTPLALLEQARALAEHIEGYQPPAELLNALAAEYARQGRHAQAYDTAMQAAAARERRHSEQAGRRLTALQLRFHSERASAEAQHHKQLAEAEARRAEQAQRNSATLEQLGHIGQQLTAQLDTGALLRTLHHHVQSLLDASGFCVYQLDAQGDAQGLWLESIFDVEHGRHLAPVRIALDDPHSHAARCARERREVLLELAPEQPSPTQEPGTMHTLSALFAPLLVKERVLGVLTLQSPHPQAYGEHERMIFRSLCAYTAIALDNAAAYQRLRDAQDQLVAQEKLAALGALVAGVAHELNTPIGNALLMASTLQHKITALEQSAQGPGLRRRELFDFLGEAASVSQIISRGLQSAAELVASFKQVAVDRSTEQRRVFRLAQTSRDLVATMMSRLRHAGHRIELHIPEDLELDGYPGPYGQVLGNLINNALLHGFDGRDGGGLMRLSARLLDGQRVELRFEDDGVGIPPAHLHRLFEPFFTTKLGQGGSGLGLSISYNIVGSLFGGELRVESPPGQGACFVLTLPRVAPRPQG